VFFVAASATYNRASRGCFDVFHMHKKIINLLLPNQCILCQSKTHRDMPLCIACENDLPWNLHPCQRCGKHMEAKNQLTCGQCITKLPNYDRCFTAFRYLAPVNGWISSMKFFDQWHYSRILGQLFAKHLLRTIEKKDYPELILPVPLHVKRLQKRGFNQALELAKPIATALNIPIETQSIQRIKNTLPQSELKKNDRTKNIKKAFHLRKPITAKHIAIIDDVITTGNTITELTKTLKKAGAHRIDVWACARAE